MTKSFIAQKQQKKIYCIYIYNDGTKEIISILIDLRTSRGQIIRECATIELRIYNYVHGYRELLEISPEKEIAWKF